MKMPDKLKAVIRITIINALKKANGNVVYAAKLLGISRAGIYYKMEKLEIDPDDYRSVG
jgi:transcriptional regulator of acetoin/glycerol metabolism